MRKSSSTSAATERRIAVFDKTMRLYNIADQLQLLKELMDRGLSGDALQLSFNAAIALTITMGKLSEELRETAEMLEDA